MSETLELFSINLFYMMRGALLMFFILMCASLYSKRKDNSILNLLFGILTAVLILVLPFSIGYMIDTLRNNEYFLNLRILVNLCFVPMIGSFLLKIIVPDKINMRKIFLISSPSIISVIVYAFTYDKILITFSFIYTALFSIFIFIFVIYISKRYDSYLKNNYSNIDNKTVEWVRVAINLFATWYILWVLKTKIDNRWFDSAFYLFLIIIWIFIYKHAIKHVAVSNIHELFKTPKEVTVAGIESINKRFDPDLEQYMHIERPWLNSSLTLQDLALAINTNRTYLSEYFNKTLDTTFYDYLNSYRIQYACEILLLESNLSLIQVGEKSGFNSLSTFQRAFDKQIGCTPAKYRKKNMDA